MRIIHVSDMHLGIFPKAYSKIDPSTGIRVRAEDFTNSFLFVVDFAAREKVDAILMCGDVFDRIDPVNKVRKDVLDSLTKLTGKGAKVVIIGGNHDTPRLPGSASPLQLLDHIEGVTVFHKPSPEPLILESKRDHDEVDIYPFPYLPPARWFDLRKSDLNVAERELTIADRQRIIVDTISTTLKDMANISRSRDHRKSILMMHYMIDGSDIGHTTYVINDIVLPRTEIPFGDFSYTACGHVHKYQSLNRSSDEAMAFYSGSTERTSFNEYDEEKGFILLDTSREGRFLTKFIRVPTRPMRLVEFRTPYGAGDTGNGKDPSEGFLRMLEGLKTKGEVKDTILRILIRNATEQLKANLNLRQDEIDTILRNAFHWEIDFELRRDQVNPSITADELFLKPSEELIRFVNAIKKMTDEEKRRITRLGEKIIDEVIEKVGEAR